MKTLTLDTDQVNDLLQLINSNITTSTLKLTEDVLDGEYEELLGFKVKVKTDGEHKSDYQMVEYKFTFTSPKGNVTNLVTSMSLMNGFDVENELKLNYE